MNARGIAHVIKGGSCTVCGDTAEWLAERLGPRDSIEYVE